MASTPHRDERRASATRSSSATLATSSTFLFCPANKPERVLKAAAVADVVIVDLEDSVSPQEKDYARHQLISIARVLDPTKTIVRVNSFESRELADDLTAIDSTPLTLCMLPKAESVTQLDYLARFHVVALCETPLGVLNVSAIAQAANCIGLMWGSEDLAVEVGAPRSRTEAGSLTLLMQSARWAVLLAAKAAHVAAIDAVFTDLEDENGLRRECAEAVEGGFDAKACIHPTQVPTVRDGFRPSADDLTWARTVIARARDAQGDAFRLSGAMVDAPVVRRAQTIISRAEAAMPPASSVPTVRRITGTEG